VRQAHSYLAIGSVLLMLGGCVRNRSSITSDSTDAEVNQLLKATFDAPMVHDERLLAVFSLIDPNHIRLAVVDDVENGNILAMLAKPGWDLWPLKSNATLLLSFDDAGYLVSHHRWPITDLTRTITLEEAVDERSSVERKRHYIFHDAGQSHACARVYLSELQPE
jgi:hypothetical protein